MAVESTILVVCQCFSRVLEMMRVAARVYRVSRAASHSWAPSRSSFCSRESGANLKEWIPPSYRFMSASPSETTTSSSGGLQLSDNFVKRMHEIEREDGRKRALRLTVDSGGCSGFQYSFGLDDDPKSDDRVFEKDGAKLLVDPISYDFVKGSTVDFSEELIRSSFMVTSNPNAASGCGCGASFAAK